MTGRRYSRQLVLAVLGVTLGLATLAGLALLLGRGRSFPAATAASPLGWTVPLVSLFVILGVTWLLLSQTPRDPEAGSFRYSPCSECGRSVLRDWRLCPYCGSMLDPTDDPEGGVT